VAFRLIDEDSGNSDVLLAWSRNNLSPLAANFVNVAMAAIKAGTVAPAPARIRHKPQ